MRRILKNVIAFLLLIGLTAAGLGYWMALTNNVNSDKEKYALLIPKNADFDFVCQKLEEGKVLKSMGSFKRIADIRSYPSLVKPGRYTIKAGTNNWDLVRKLRAGDQDQMKLRFRTHWTLEELATEIGGQLMLDEADLLAKMKDSGFLKKYGTNPAQVRNLFIPNTYFVYWTLSVDQLFKKLKTSYDEFWNGDRRSKAANLGMSIQEVTTLASIVQAETYLKDERPTVAGLYLNRLRDNIPLQADPTVIFANGDFTIKRVLKKHLEFDSPYNTYKYAGLPPGPINNPEPSALKGVLNAEKHRYIYMCANSDFSGHHKFARSYAQHLKNARAYQKALSKMQREKKNK